MSGIVQQKDPVGEEVFWCGPDRSIDPPHMARSELSGGELAKLRGVTMRALRFYESRGLISPRRDGRVRCYSERDSERVGLILKAKKLGFTLAEIGHMIDAQDAQDGAGRGTAASGGLHLTAQKCLQQIGHLERQMRDIMEALADLRRIHLEICCKANDAAGDAK
jgi:DNA-binding transcriptional MerR regulator